MPNYSVRLKCPLCSFTHVFNQTGSRAVIERRPIPEEAKIFHFGKEDPDKLPFVDVRQANGRWGNPPGFPRVEDMCLTIEQACQESIFSGTIEEVYQTAKKIVEIIEKERRGE